MQSQHRSVSKPEFYLSNNEEKDATHFIFILGWSI